MKRRDALTAMLSALLWPPSVPAQRQPMPVIGVLVTHPPLTNPVFDYLRAGLKKFGYFDGTNIKTAKLLHIKIPESIMIRTDEVIR